jgi:amino acid transporter
MLLVAVLLNIVGLNVGKWLQNAGGVGTYVPLLMLAGIAALVVLSAARLGNAFHRRQHAARMELGYGQLLVADRLRLHRAGACLLHERRGARPARTLPRAVFGAGALIALMYIAGTFAILALVPAADLDPQSGVFHAIAVGSVALRIGFLGILAAMLVTVGNAGGVGSTVAGIARVPLSGGNRPLPARRLRQDSSALEDALYLHPCAGRVVGRILLGARSMKPRAAPISF